MTPEEEAYTEALRRIPEGEGPRSREVRSQRFSIESTSSGAFRPHLTPIARPGSVQLTASTKTDRDLREDWDGRKSGRQEAAGAA
jgi:hypothetical protein